MESSVLRELFTEKGIQDILPMLQKYVDDNKKEFKIGDEYYKVGDIIEIRNPNMEKDRMYPIGKENMKHCITFNDYFRGIIENIFVNISPHNEKTFIYTIIFYDIKSDVLASPLINNKRIIIIPDGGYSPHGVTIRKLFMI